MCWKVALIRFSKLQKKEDHVKVQEGEDALRGPRGSVKRSWG